MSENELVRANLGLVFSLVDTVHGPAPKEELISAGMEALLRAVRGFRPSLGNKFSSYAVPSIRREMHKAQRRYQRAAQLEPGNIEQRASSQTLLDSLPDLSPLARLVASWRFGLDGRRERTEHEIASFLGITPEDVLDILREVVE